MESERGKVTSKVVWILRCVAWIFVATRAVVANKLFDSRRRFVTPSSIVSDPSKVRNAIVFLLPEFYQVLDGFTCSRPCSIVDKHSISSLIKSVDEHFRDYSQADVIIFHEGYPALSAMTEIRASTSRTVDFVNVDSVFLRPPNGVEPFVDDPDNSPQKRGKWRHSQMVRFLFRDIFQFAVMDNVKYMLLVHSDACVVSSFGNIFSQLKSNVIYVGNPIRVDISGSTGQRLRDLAEEHLKVNSLVATYAAMYNTILSESLETSILGTPAEPTSMIARGFDTAVELLSVQFFRLSEVSKFLNVVVNSGGIFANSWELSHLRYLTISMFAKPKEIIMDYRKMGGLQRFNITFQHPCLSNN